MTSQLDWDAAPAIGPYELIDDDFEKSVTPTAEPFGSRDDDTNAAPPPEWLHFPEAPHPLEQPFGFVVWSAKLVVALAATVLLLAITAAIPLVNFIALGYLLDAQGRLGRTGAWSAALPHLGPMFRLGTALLGCWLWVLPLRAVSGAAADAALIAPGSSTAGGLAVLTNVLAVLIGLHLALALACGGRLSAFVRPIRNVRLLKARWSEGDFFRQIGDGLSRFVAALRIRGLFLLGLKGFAVAFAWLFVPTALFGALRDTSKPGQVLATLIGGLLLCWMFRWVPFFQARMATENRFRSGFDWKTVRELGRRAPVCWSLAVILLYTAALPLYLLKIALPPADAMWLVTLLFIVMIFPARLLIGWAYHQAVQRDERAHWLWRYGCTLVVYPLLGLFTFLLFFTPAIGEQGHGILFEHHALLLPSPF